MNGLTIWVCFGKYAGWRFELHIKELVMLRIILGWVSFCVIALDVDLLLGVFATKNMKEKAKQ